MTGEFQDIFRIRANRLEAGPGNVLIAEPFMRGLHFARSVIYMVEHGKKGSVGFVLNKPTPYIVSALVPELQNVNFTVYMGGPVEQNRLYYIHSHPEVENALPVSDGIFWGGDFGNLCRLLGKGSIAEDEIRFFSGYSGWDGGQLERELAEHSWMVGDIPHEKFFKIPDDELWVSSMCSLGWKYRIWAGFPEDPTMN